MKINFEGTSNELTRTFEDFRKEFKSVMNDFCGNENVIKPPTIAELVKEDVSSQTSVNVTDFFEAVEAFKKLPHISRYKLSNMKISEFTDIFLPPERGDGNGENL